MIRMSCPNEGGAGSCVVSTSVSLLRKTATSSKPRAQNSGQKTASTQKKRSEASMSTSSIGGSRLDSEEPEMSQAQVQPPSSTTTTITTMTPTTPQVQPQKKPQKLRRRVATMAQRRAANIRERRRMFNLNSAFDRLRKKVPSFAYEKRLSRIETLKLAIMYIRFMDDLVKDEAYAEKYKRLTSNYPPQLPSVPATISNHTNELMAHSAATFMSPYLSTLYGRCDSTPPSAPSPDSLLLHPLQQQQQRHLDERTRPTKLEPDLEASTDRERYLLASGADGTTQNIMQRQLCTDGHCASARQHYDHQLHYGSISAAASCSPSTTAPTATTVATPTLHNPSIGGAAAAASNSAASSVVCCSSPALSSSCNSSSASTCNSSSSSSSLNSFANDSPDSSPHQLLQLHQAPQFQQQPLVYSAATDYYQKQQQQQAYGGAYPLDQTTPCLPMYATTTVTGQAGNQSSEPASKMFAFGYESADNARRQGQRQAGESQIAGRRSLAEYCIEPASVSSSPPTAATATNLAQASLSMGEQQQQHHHSGHPLGYTLHSLQAR